MPRSFRSGTSRPRALLRLDALLFVALALIVPAAVRVPAQGNEKKEQNEQEEKETPTRPREAKEPELVVDEKAGVVKVPARVAEQEVYEVLEGAIEYLLVSRGGKAYETLFVTDIEPEKLHEAFEKIGLRAGRPALDGAPPRGSPVKILVERERDGKTDRRPVDRLIVRKDGGRPLEAAPWTYTGSREGFDPEAGKKALQASITKSIVGLHYTDPSSLVQNSRKEARQENIYAANLEELPPRGTLVFLVFEKGRADVPEGTERVRVLIRGRVQGVGFRSFTQREARRLGLTGHVKNLEDGRVEAVVEGPGEKVAKLLAKLERGPRAARVEKVERREEEPLGDYADFEIEY